MSTMKDDVSRAGWMALAGVVLVIAAGALSFLLPRPAANPSPARVPTAPIATLEPPAPSVPSAQTTPGDGGGPAAGSSHDDGPPLPERSDYVPETVRENPPDGYWYVLDAYSGEWILMEDSWLITPAKAQEYGWGEETWRQARAAAADFATTINSYSAERWADEAYRDAAKLATASFAAELDERALQVGAPSQGDIDSGVFVDASVDYSILVETSSVGDVGTVDETHAVAMVVWRTWTKEGTGSFVPQDATTTSWYQLEHDGFGWLVAGELTPSWPDEHAHGD